MYYPHKYLASELGTNGQSHHYSSHVDFIEEKTFNPVTKVDKFRHDRTPQYTPRPKIFSA